MAMLSVSLSLPLEMVSFTVIRAGSIIIGNQSFGSQQTITSGSGHREQGASAQETVATKMRSLTMSTKGMDGRDVFIWYKKQLIIVQLEACGSDYRICSARWYLLCTALGLNILGLC